MKIRIMFAQPKERPPFIGNEIEGKVTIDTNLGVVTGFYGSFESLDGPTGPIRQNSVPFTVKLTSDDLAAIAQVVLRRAAEQGVGGMDAGSRVEMG